MGGLILPPKIGKEILNASYPKGSAWKPALGKGLDQTRDAIGEIIDNVNEKMEESRNVRNPLKTPVLSDLERDYGIVPNDLVSDDDRRLQLKEKKNNNYSPASATYLENLLNDSGFDVQVHRNDPPVDPNIFLNQAFIMVAGGGNAFAGHEDAYAGRVGGFLLVNGSIFDQFPAYAAQAGGISTVAGNGNAIAGFFTSLNKIPIVYEIPSDPDDWGFIFFVGGDAVRDGITNELISIEAAQVDSERRTEFETLILTIKGLYTWAGMLIEYN